jgi:hypothetical protein
LRTLLRQLHPVGCQCDKTDPPCQGGLSPEDGLNLARLAYPAEYQDPPPPPVPALALTRRARVALLSLRQRAGLHLYHPADMTDMPRLGVGAERDAGNGSVRETGVACG